MTDLIFIVAAERSGDDLGAGLIREIKVLAPNVALHGIGGAAMSKEGVRSHIDIAPLSILGFTEAIKAYPVVLNRVQQSVDYIMECAPSVVVLIDSWGFMIRIAQRLKKSGFKGQIIKYVAPQVFAMREGRAKILAAAVDHLMTIHSFDAPYFERNGLSVTYVGNPMFDTDYNSGDGKALKTRLGIAPHEAVVAILLGSRMSEITRLSAPFGDAISRLKADDPNIHFISPVSGNIATQVRGMADGIESFKDVTFLPEKNKFDVFAAADVALACSGTVTTQLACAGVPTVVAYKLSPVTYFFAKRLFKPDYISLVNIAADRCLMPEFIQGDCIGEKLAQAMSEYFRDYAKRSSASQELLSQTHLMKGAGGSASKRAAETVLSLI